VHATTMLARYQIVRGKRAANAPLPQGKRLDTRKHTHHFLRPEAEQVAMLLGDPSAAAHARFARAYQALLAARFAQDRSRFDALAELAAHAAVYLGCSCPSRANPDLQRCHTLLALRFMKKKYPRLEVIFP
jgi:hypothetical protein